MSYYTVEEVADTFLACPNTNAAFKNLLKREVQKGSPVERLIKTFKKVLSARDRERLVQFIQKYHEDFATYFLLLASYAFETAVTSSTETVVEKFADDFNSTYETGDDGIKVNDREQFEAIGNKVRECFLASIDEHGLPQNAFVLSAFSQGLFEEQVLKEISPVIHAK